MHQSLRWTHGGGTRAAEERAIPSQQVPVEVMEFRPSAGPVHERRLTLVGRIACFREQTYANSESMPRIVKLRVPVQPVQCST
jgi:hypothetical protein